MKSTLFLLVAFHSLQLFAVDSIESVLSEQRSALLAPAAFKIEFSSEILINGVNGPRKMPAKTGTAILAKDGRFIIYTKTTTGEKTQQSMISVFAWDGNSLYRGPDSQTTYVVGKSSFPKYLKDPADAEFQKRVPFVDLYEGISPVSGENSGLTYDGIGVHLACLDVFSYMSLHDLYYSEKPGKFGPRWCDVANDELFKVNAQLADEKDFICAAGQDFAIVNFTSGKREGLKRGGSYYFQMKISKGPLGRRVTEVTQRGPWMSIALQAKENITQADLKNLSNVSGERATFKYSKDLASGWFPSEIESIRYEQPENYLSLPKGSLAPAAQSTAISQGIARRTSTWKTTAFEPLGDDDLQSAFDEFTMSQKNIVDISKLAGWKSRYEESSQKEP